MLQACHDAIPAAVDDADYYSTAVLNCVNL